MDNMTDAATWPEQNAIMAWCEKNGLNTVVTHRMRFELADELTKIRLFYQNRADTAEDKLTEIAKCLAK
jgi:hypothetical protein